MTAAACMPEEADGATNKTEHVGAKDCEGQHRGKNEQYVCNLEETHDDAHENFSKGASVP